MTDFTADRILAIPVTAPEELFVNDPRAARQQFVELGKKWHPDVNQTPGAATVFQHITALYREAKRLIGTAGWKRHSSLTFRTKDKETVIPYAKQHPFELGAMYVGDEHVVYAVDKQHSDLFHNAKQIISGFKYRDAEMEKEIARYLPRNVEYYTTADRHFMVIPKTKDVILLQDLNEHFAGKLDPRHVAWIQSTLHNISCYLRYAGLVHGDIRPFTYFISPQHHSGLLLGGWWYAKKVGERLKVLPARSANLCPPDIRRNKAADPRLDLELIRAMGRELLGDIAGVKFRKDKSIPKSLSQWFNGTTTGDAVTDYRLWKDVLTLSFGKPKFVALHIDADTIYSVRK